MPELSVALLLAIAAIGLAVLSLSLWRAQQRRADVIERELSEIAQQMKLHGQSISGLTAGALGMDKRMSRVEAEERALSQRQETFENQQIPDRPYHHAIKLVQQGAGAGRLVDELELSRSEAELIVRLHGAPAD